MEVALAGQAAPVISVCGPRNLTAEALPTLILWLGRLLKASQPFEPGFVLAHGAARGADMLWERALLEVHQRYPLLWMPVRRFPARWKEEGRAAGPERNQRMLEQVRPTYWLAASYTEEPNTPGTSDMVARLRGAQVPGRVVVVPGLATARESAT